jgi:hypothetical protein
MRGTTLSIAAKLLLAVGIAIFWPSRNAVPGAAEAVAQAADPFAPAAKRRGKSQPARAADPFAPGPAEAEPAPARPDPAPAKPTSASVLEEKLNQVTSLDPVETPLTDLVTIIRDMHQLPIMLKTKTLDEAGVSIDTPITKRVANMRLRTALDLILEELELTYVVLEEVVVITTPEDAQSRMEIRVYDCRDLLSARAAGKSKPAPAESGEGAAAAAAGAAPPLPGSYGGAPGMPGGMMAGMGGGYGGYVSERDQRARQLITILTTNVDDQSWQTATNPPLDENNRPQPGRGVISEYDGLIVVTQTAQTHRKIEHVLEMLRRAAGLDVSKAGKVVR